MLRVHVLGELALERNGEALRTPEGRRARELLGWLALHPGTHPRGELAARFWPDVLDASARASLRSAAWSLRRALGEDGERHLHATRERIGLDGDVWVDARAFEVLVREGRCEEAVALCRGELLPGVEEEWALAARDDHRNRLVGTLEQLAAAAETADDMQAAVAWTRRQVAADPFDEGSHRRLMTRLERAGDSTSALTAYTRLRERLRRELGTAPSGPTRALAERIRRGEGGGPGGPGQTVRLAAGDQTARLAAGGQTVRLAAGALPLVGRERELGELLAAWEGAQGGAGQVVVLAGEAGIGKTRLAAELLTRAAAGGGRIASCAALDLNGGAPLGLWAELARELAEGLPAPPAEAAWPADLGVLVPEVARRFAHPTATRSAVPPELERARLFEAAAELLAWSTQHGPVVLLVEDLHLADRASLELLAYVGRRIGSLRLLCLLTRRQLPRRPDADAVEQALRSRGVLTRELVLGSLSPAAMERLVREVANLTPHDVGRVVAAADGNPLLAVESARAAGRGEGGPAASLRAAVRTTMANLSPHATRLAQLCAVSGRELERPELLRLVLDRAADSAAEGMDSGLLVAAHGRVGYRHALLREAVYTDMPEPRRAELHETLAEALTSGDDLGAPRRAAEAARHLRLAGRDDRALAQLARAAAHARTVGALAETVAFLEEALEIAPGDPDVLLDLTEALMWLGRREDADARFAEALTRLQDGEPLPLVRALLRHADWHRGAQCAPRVVLASAGRALDLLDGAGAGAVPERADALAASAWAHAVAGDPERAGELVEQLDGLMARERAGDLRVYQVEYARQHTLIRSGRFEDSYEVARRAGGAAQRAGRADLAYGPWLNGAGAAACAGDLDCALELATCGLEAVTGRSLASPEVHARAGRTTVLLLLGRLDDARREADQEREVAERAGDPRLRAIADHDRGAVALAEGDSELAQELLARALAVPAAVSRPLTRLARAEALVHLRRLEEAEQELRATALEPVTPGDMPDTLVPRLTRMQGLIAAQRGDLELAARRLREAAAGWSRLAGVMRAGETLVAALADLGRPALGIVQPDRELERLERELAALEHERSAFRA